MEFLVFYFLCIIGFQIMVYDRWVSRIKMDKTNITCLDDYKKKAKRNIIIIHEKKNKM